MSLHQELLEKLESFFVSFGEDESFEDIIDWNGINEILLVSPQLVWNGDIRLHKDTDDTELKKLANLIAIYENLDEMKFINTLIRKNSSLELLEERLSLAFETRDSFDELPVDIAASLEKLEMLKYLVEECCPSGYMILDYKNAEGETVLTHALYNNYRSADTIDYILSVAPRGLRMLNDVSYNTGLSNLQLGTGNEYRTDNNEIKEYLKNINLVFLEKEHDLIRQAREHLRGQGNELPDLMLGITEGNTELLHYRERLK